MPFPCPASTLRQGRACTDGLPTSSALHLTGQCQPLSHHPLPRLQPGRHVGGAPCGCCYAFGGMAGVEAANALYTGELTTLSEQEIVDCDELDYGCDGGQLAPQPRLLRSGRAVRSAAQ